jgi:hypothetical protein
VALPAVTPVKTPDVRPIVAIAVLLLVHEPPVVADDKVEVKPSHTTAVPVITAGSGFTVAGAKALQPVASV